MSFITIRNRRLEYAFFEENVSRPYALVLLHEGLGSLSMWGDFPLAIATATGCRTLVYSRFGYGRSARLDEPRRVDYLHDEALALRELLEAMDLEAPVLCGHSDGASIALLHAAAGTSPVRRVIAMAPHVKVEDVTVAGIFEAKRLFETTDLPLKLRRHHDDVEATFWGWNRIWLEPAFRSWNIEDVLPRITCPVLAIQGYEDQYGTMEQIDAIARAHPDTRLLKLENCGHSPHRDRREAVLNAAVQFLDE